MEEKKVTILIIEDEELMVSALKQKLMNANFEVLTARDGKEGLRIAKEYRPDLILLDLILPVMDGVTFLEHLRGSRWGKALPVIVLSNLSTATTLQEVKEKGVSDYLVKTDWTIGEVINKIRKQLNIE